MDTLTHGVIGALLARSCTKVDVKKSYLLITAVAAAFPDIDYLFFWLNPYQFITEWHRGLSHSLLMLPIWAAMISMVIDRVMHKRIAFRKLFACCCLGLLSHIAIDLVTVYGLQLFAPFSSRRYALFIVFDIDPWIAMLALLGMILGFYKRRFARLGLLVISTYLLLVFNFQQTAIKSLKTRIGNSQELTEHSYAIPQPFLPFHWQLVIDRHDHYEIAHLSLFTRASKLVNNQIQIGQSYGVFPVSVLQDNTKNNDQIMIVNKDWKKYDFSIPGISEYRSGINLEWKKMPKFGDSDRVIRLAKQVWQHQAFSDFREFALVPILYRYDQDSNSKCLWFTDLRYVFPMMMPPFRYGMCRYDQNDEWKLFRLRRHSENSRQLINF